MGLNITLDEFCQMRAAEEGKHELRYEEQRAGELLTSILRAVRWDPKDVGGVNNMHDLDIVLRDGARVGVEVTSDTDEKRAAFLSEIEDENKNPIVTKSLNLYWQIDAFSTARLRHIRQLIEPILNEAEQNQSVDEIRLRPWQETEADSDTCKKLRALNVKIARGWRPNNPECSGEIWIQPPWTEASPFGMEDLAAVAEEHIHIRDNRCKLQNAKRNGAKEAHLFIWLQGIMGRSAAAWAQSKTPPLARKEDILVDLRGLDSVWLVSSGRFTGLKEDVRGHSNAVWQYSEGQWVCHERVWQERRLDV